MVGYELIPLNKVCAVPSNETAFHSRGPQANVVVVVSWDKEEKEGDGVPHARAISQELARLIESTADKAPTDNENHVYSNYGMYRDNLSFVDLIPTSPSE